MSSDSIFRVLFAGLPNSGKKPLLEKLLYGKVLKKRNKTKTLEYHKARIKYMHNEFTLTFIDLPTENTGMYLNEKYINDVDLLVCVISQSQLRTKSRSILDLYWSIMDVIPSVDVILCINTNNKTKGYSSKEMEQIKNIARDIGADKFIEFSLNDLDSVRSLLKEIIHYFKLKYSIE